MSTAQIDSISSGTMRDADLLPVFAEVLVNLLAEEEEPNKEHTALATEASEIANAISDGYNFDGGLDDRIGCIMADLFMALDSYSPPYCRFGAHEGDGSDYGFWIDWDSVETAVQDKNLLKVDDLSEVLEGYHGDVLLVNDHGNVTLYGPVVSYREIWAVV